MKSRHIPFARSRSHRIVFSVALFLAIGGAVWGWQELRVGWEASPADLEQRARARPDDVSAQMEWGSALQSQGRSDEARTVFQTAARHAAADTRPLHALAAFAIERKRPDEALRYFQTALQRKPDDVTAWRSTALLLQQQNRSLEALTAYTRVTELAPNAAFAWQQRGILERAFNQPVQGLQHLQRAAALDPKDLLTQDLLGEAALADGQLTVAKQAFARALALRPDDARALLGGADTLLQQAPSPLGLAQAGPQIERALAARPTAYAYFVRGRWRLLQRNYPQAVSDLKTALDLEPRRAVIHSFLSQAYAALGDAENARRESAAFMAAHNAARSPQSPTTAVGQER